MQRHRYIRVVVMALAALLALGALPVGAMFIAVPDGSLVGASTGWLLTGLPFSTFLVPGLFLAGLVGGGALVVLIATWRRARGAPLCTALLGVVVMVWILVQVALVNRHAALQPAIFAVGLALAVAGYVGGARLWLRWVAANALGELVGLGGVAVGLTLASRLPGGAATFLPAVLLLGAFEGLVVGYAQAHVLRDLLPTLLRRQWVVGTVLGAVTAWILGSLPGLLLGGGGGPPPVIDDRLQAALAAGLGLVAGPLLAAFQVVELRRRVAHPWWWLPANGVAWAAAMPLLFIGGGLATVLSPEVIARELALVVAAGAIVGSIHGLALLRLARAR